MKGLAELVVSLCDLCEAEGRLLEAGILRTVRRAALLSLGLLFGAAALALLLAALYALLTSLLPTPAALALLGCASAAIAGLLLWGARGGTAQEARASKPEKQAETTTGTAETGPASTPAASKPAQKPDTSHVPWADVAPYGHSAGTDASPKGGTGMQEKR